MRMIKVVFIDVDNTLLDFDKSAKLSMQAGFEDLGLHFEDFMFDRFRTINLDMWREMEKGNLTKEELIRTRWQNVFDDLGIVANGVEFEEKFRIYLNEIAVEVDGAKDALKYLASKYTVCVASNAPYEQQIHRLQSADMIKYIDKVFVSEKIGFPKPRKEFFDACFIDSPFRPDDAIMIGDSLTADIKGAREYGIKTCWYNHYNENTDSIGCDYIISSLNEIKRIL